MAKNPDLKTKTKAHLTATEPECRWCFAIDGARVKGEKSAQHDFPDATIIVFSCPRCRGEFTLYFQAWSGKYVAERLLKLHPDMKGRSNKDLIADISLRVYPENDNTRRKKLYSGEVS